jgi:hypothetical protein
MLKLPLACAGKVAVGVVGEEVDISFLEMLALKLELASESPRAGRSSRWEDPYDEPEVTGESS